jgi:hypothetical protein
MKITNFRLFALIGVLIAGLMILAILLRADESAISRLNNQHQISVPESYTAASLSKETILLLLAVGVIGALGISRTKKGIGKPAQRNAIDSASDYENVNEERQKLITKNS